MWQLLTFWSPWNRFEKSSMQLAIANVSSISTHCAAVSDALLTLNHVSNWQQKCRWMAAINLDTDIYCYFLISGARQCAVTSWLWVTICDARYYATASMMRITYGVCSYANLTWEEANMQKHKYIYWLAFDYRMHKSIWNWLH